MFFAGLICFLGGAVVGWVICSVIVSIPCVRANVACDMEKYYREQEEDSSE